MIRLEEALERCAVCLDHWHNPALEPYLSDGRLVFRVECDQDCCHKTALTENPADAIEEWNAAYRKAEEQRKPTARTWARFSRRAQCSPRSRRISADSRSTAWSWATRSRSHCSLSASALCASICQSTT